MFFVLVFVNCPKGKLYLNKLNCLAFCHPIVTPESRPVAIDDSHALLSKTYFHVNLIYNQILSQNLIFRADCPSCFSERLISVWCVRMWLCSDLITLVYQVWIVAGVSPRMACSGRRHVSATVLV